MVYFPGENIIRSVEKNNLVENICKESAGKIGYVYLRNYHVYHYEYDRTGRREKRDPKEIGIHAVRGGTIVGEHEVIFAGQDEVITFSHTAYSKAIFAKGALEAARFLKGREPGLYTMADVIR